MKRMLDQLGDPSGRRILLGIAFVAMIAANLWLLAVARDWAADADESPQGGAVVGEGEPAPIEGEAAERVLPDGRVVWVPEGPEEAARWYVENLEARIREIPVRARQWGPSGIEFAHAIKEHELREEGWDEIVVKAYLDYRDAILAYYRKYPDGKAPPSASESGPASEGTQTRE